jgi:hypothetical protein
METNATRQRAMVEIVSLLEKQAAEIGGITRVVSRSLAVQPSFWNKNPVSLLAAPPRFGFEWRGWIDCPSGPPHRRRAAEFKEVEAVFDEIRPLRDR